MNSNSINKTKEALAINELLTSAIDIVDDLTNTKIPGYNKTEKANIDHLINSAVEIIYNLQTAKDQDICFDITNFKKTHTNDWTLIELSEFISIMELNVNNVNNVTDPTITTLLEDIDLIKKAIETYNSNKNQQIINDLITSSIDIIYNVNKPISIPPKQTSALANALLQGIYNALDPNTYTSYIPNTYTSYIPNTYTSYIPNTYTTMKYVYNISKNTTQNIYSYAVSKKNKYLDILNKKTINGVCEELNNIVIKIADTVCELLNKQKAQAQAQAQAQANLTSSKNGMITIQHSAPCTNPIPAEFQLLGTYDNTELYYNGEENLFCTNNSPQPTVSTTNSSINKKSSSKSIPTTNIRRQDLNALVNIAVDIIDNIKNQNTNIHNLVNAAVDIIVKVKK
jgi:hypothetical protein